MTGVVKKVYNYLQLHFVIKNYFKNSLIYEDFFPLLILSSLCDGVMASSASVQNETRSGKATL